MPVRRLRRVAVSGRHHWFERVPHSGTSYITCAASSPAAKNSPLTLTTTRPLLRAGGVEPDPRGSVYSVVNPDLAGKRSQADVHNLFSYKIVLSAQVLFDCLEGETSDQEVLARSPDFHYIFSWLLRRLEIGYVQLALAVNPVISGSITIR